MDSFLVQALHAERMASIAAVAGPRRRPGRRPGDRRRRSRVGPGRRMTGRVAAAVATLAVVLVSGCSSDGASSSGATGPTTSSTAVGPHPMGEPAITPADAAAAQRATAAFQDVATAEAAGYASTVDTLTPSLEKLGMIASSTTRPSAQAEATVANAKAEAPTMAQPKGLG